MWTIAVGCGPPLTTRWLFHDACLNVGPFTDNYVPGVGRARPAPTLLGLDESRVYLRGHRPTGQSAHTERRDLLVPRGRRALASGRDSREEGKRDPRPSKPMIVKLCKKAFMLRQVP